MVMQETTGAWHSVTITAQRWPPVCQVTLMGQRVQAQALSTSPPHLHALLLYYCSPGPVTAPLTNLAWRGPQTARTTIARTGHLGWGSGGPGEPCLLLLG